ncbi:tRNA uridine-5-carboxymethylaminomethyl(34) synthesis GTPase MnmE [Occallatibacter savannae]|uniref:tRNA uridine-5-carboxymethylaminomethyl(34) synthesis GTPase MnmE n=1 Tax=Occallatibacter savannae TaxID=1002691 RepID=UPI001EF6EEBB|nr:tRNA uridine-5-carboxymethylaminomethyl(34) synthesis GTPase MnmE [Occallatibacter savannae]
MSEDQPTPEAAIVDTIAAISTPPGRGGIGIVRLSGPDSASIAVQLMQLRQPLEHGRARLASVLDEAGPEASTQPIDQAVVTLFAAPNSYTGDDLVEIAAHGSPVVLDLLLRRALTLGARLANPGEFTERAFLSGKLDLTQAEAVRDLIEAQTLTQARQAASQMGGALSRRVAPTKRSLVELIALLEAGIDFGEDDVDVTPQSEIARRIDELIPPLSALEASFARGRIVHDGLTLAIVGRPNAGKSSLFNRLVERDRAIVTATPGTTRDLVTERISLDGIPLELVDTAGLRDTLEEIEQLGIERSRQALADAAIVLIVLDATQPLNDEERTLVSGVQNRSALIAINKSDLNKATIFSFDPTASHHLKEHNLSLAETAEQPNREPSLHPSQASKGHDFSPSDDAEIINRVRSSQDLKGHVFSGAETGEEIDHVVSSEGLKGHDFSRAENAEENSGALAPEGVPPSLTFIPTSALTGEGINALREKILQLATGGAASEPGLLTNLRQQQTIVTARAALEDARRANSSGIPHEMILLDLYRALWALDSLTGQTTPDDILNLIFSTFCIGK